MKNRTLIGLVCIIVSLVVVFGGSILLNRSQTKTVFILTATQDIQEGQKITDKNVGIKEIAEGSAADASATYPNKKTADANLAKCVSENWYAKFGMIAGDQLTAKKVTTESVNINTALSSLTGEKVAISIKLNALEGQLTGKLQAGDVVSLICSDKKKKESTIPLAFQYVQLYALTTKEGIDGEEGMVDSEGKKVMPATATLLLTPLQATMLKAEITNNGTPYVVLVYRGDQEHADEFLKVTDDYIEGLEETARKVAERRFEEVETDNKDFNEYYELHRDEFISVLNEVYEQVFGMHIETDDSSAFEEEEENEDEDEETEDEED